MTTAYQLTHQHTADLHYCGPDSAGRPIIVDAAEITAGHFEVAAFWGNGDEIESDEVEDIDTARRLYSELLHKLTAPKPQQAAAKPLTGKYAKLRDDLKAALAAGRAVEDDDPEDGGACNFDAASLLLPRWKEALVEQAAEEAGTGCFTWSLFGKKRFVFRPNTNGQANARSRNAEAMTDALARMGYQAFCYQQFD